MNILYYGMDNTPNADGISFGPINVTLQQVSVGIITNLIVFPPSLLLVQLFRRIKRRRTRLMKIKMILKEKNFKCLDQNEKKLKNKEKKSCELKFPWWFRIVAYMLSFSIAGACLFFVILKGIEFGNEKVTKWLTSLIISFLTSILFTQPLQVKNSY